ncbi:phosphotransferase family protein [Salarchaeum japonicum]|uniref:phosphotransferase family protein n=1 Tax=Salarchaeum japonicum TaxID=555573 RepID=UPI003C71B6B3
MAEEAPESGDADVSDSMVREMVAELKPDWQVTSIERSPYGTDLVAILEVRTPEPQSVVLKATTADFVDPIIARSEPRLLELVHRETTIPVPAVFGYCDDHRHYPAPFYVMDYVEGANYENRLEELPRTARETLLREAGENLAELHELGPLPAPGKIGVQDGELCVLDTDDYPRHDDFHDAVLADCMETLDTLTAGGFYPDLADDPERFADLVPELREHVRERVPDLSEPEEPTYCHWDYRTGNLLIDPDTGETRAVLDWANLSSAEPAYNLGQTEFYLLNPVADGPRRTSRLRETFRTAYADARTDWEFTESVRERIDVYRLVCRLGAMGCLPLWYQDASPEERNERAAEHRSVVNQHLAE